MKVTKCDICNGETDMDIRLSVISNGDYQMIGADLCYPCFGRIEKGLDKIRSSSGLPTQS